MTIETRRQVVFWLLLGAFFLFAIATLREILAPFVLGLVIAYLLDPLADMLERWGFSRAWATMLIVIVISALLVISLIVLLPILLTQFLALIDQVPGYLETLRNLANSYGRKLLGEGFVVPDLGNGEALREMTRKYAGSSGELLKSLWSGGMALVSFMALILVTPVVAFYMLYDWDRMVKLIQGWLPRDHERTIRRLAKKIDIVIAGFLRGQVSVCFLLGAFYAIALSFAGLNSAVLIGLVAGILSFIPFVGSATGFIVSFAVAIGQFWPEWQPIAIIVGIFVAGQVLEGNFLTPMIIGDKVRLHPVWLIFALFVFGYLFGFVGMLLAVPVAAAIGVLVRFGLEKYLQSPFYEGQQGENGEQAEAAGSDAAACGEEVGQVIDAPATGARGPQEAG